MLNRILVLLGSQKKPADHTLRDESGNPILDENSVVLTDEGGS